MGSGSWNKTALSDYVTKTKKVTLDEFEATKSSAQTFYESRALAPELNPKNVMRECCDSEEHPNTLPVILALDVTGSMGSAAVKVATKLDQIMTDLYEDDNIKDIEFCIMGIGDLAYDDAPVQMSQFESDIRIIEQMDKIYFEGHGGGNDYESYSAAWYAGINNCKLDCWNRGRKGIIITLGDELPNPYLPSRIGEVMGNRHLQGGIETKELLSEVRQKYNVFHISVNDEETSYHWYKTRDRKIDEKWIELLGKENYFISNLDSLSMIITDIIKRNGNGTVTTNSEVVSW